jgi:hypothetical protein
VRALGNAVTRHHVFAMTRLTTLLFALVVAVALSGCKDFPGADGRYASHDRGNTHGSP